MAELPDLAGAVRLDERLREVATDVQLVEQAVTAARAALAEALEPQQRLRLLGYLGNALRMLGRYDEAVAAQEQALRLARTLCSERGDLVSRIRLAEVWRCADELDRAEKELRHVLAQVRRRPELGLTSFALQHLGKTLLDAERPHEAEPLLREALALREATGDEALVESTRLALARAAAAGPQ